MDHNEHGGRIFEAAEILGLSWTEICDFSANINPFGQPKGLKNFIHKNFDQTLNYPEEKALSFIQGLARFHDLSPDHFLPGAGSTVHIFLLARLFCRDLSVIVGPAFSEYEASLKAAKASFTYVQTKAADDFLWTEQTLESIFYHKPKVIFLANPANPTGRLVPPHILEELLSRALQQNIFLIIDEAFLGFTTAYSLVPKVLNHPNLVVLRSLTKIMAIPGLRLAYLAASPPLVAQLWTQLGPWPLSTPALLAGQFALNPEFDFNTLPDKISKLRDKLKVILGPFGHPFPSECNFLLFEYGGNSLELIKYLFNNAVLVRNAQNFLGIGRNFLRLAVRPEKEILILDRLLEKYHA
jgi:threonine-phosphate decarboxylase